MLKNLKIEHKENDYDEGALMLNFKIDRWEELEMDINPNDLYEGDSDRYGVEREPHCTILLGTIETDESYPIRLLKYVKDDNREVYPITIKEMGMFDSQDYDVLIWKLESKPLSKLNARLKENFKNSNRFPEYHPHFTIAYLKKGKAKEYLQVFNSKHSNHFKGNTYVSNILTYSSPNNTFYTLKL